LIAVLLMIMAVCDVDVCYAGRRGKSGNGKGKKHHTFRNKKGDGNGPKKADGKSKKKKRPPKIKQVQSRPSLSEIAVKLLALDDSLSNLRENLDKERFESVESVLADLKLEMGNINQDSDKLPFSVLLNDPDSFNNILLADPDLRAEMFSNYRNSLESSVTFMTKKRNNEIKNRFKNIKRYCVMRDSIMAVAEMRYPERASDNKTVLVRKLLMVVQSISKFCDIKSQLDCICKDSLADPQQLKLLKNLVKASK